MRGRRPESGGAGVPLPSSLLAAAVIALGLLVVWGLATVARAQPPTPPPSSILGGSAALSATSVSSRVALPGAIATFPVVAVFTTGAVTAYCAGGNSSVVATTSSPIVVVPGYPISTVLFGATHLACITAAGTAPIVVTSWNGAPGLAAGPLNRYVLVAQSGNPTPVTGSTGELPITSVTIPPLSANDSVRVSMIWTCTSSGNAKTMRMRYDTAAGITGTVLFTSGAQTAITSYFANIIIRNRNATNSQISGAANGGSGAQSNVLTTLDTTAATVLNFTGDLANSGDTINLQGYTVEVLRAPS